MAGNKTIDGIKIQALVKMLGKIPQISVREGSKHPYIAISDGIRPCPIATSTNVKTMVVPWLAQVIGYNSKSIYNSIRCGEWYL